MFCMLGGQALLAVTLADLASPWQPATAAESLLDVGNRPSNFELDVAKLCAGPGQSLAL